MPDFAAVFASAFVTTFLTDAAFRQTDRCDRCVIEVQKKSGAEPC
jgi:hypothetical protein